MECKYWQLVDEVEIKEAFSFNLNPSATKEIKKIIYQHFDLIVESWSNHFNPDFAVEIYYKKKMLQIQAFA